MVGDIDDDGPLMLCWQEPSHGVVWCGRMDVKGSIAVFKEGFAILFEEWSAPVVAALLAGGCSPKKASVFKVCSVAAAAIPVSGAVVMVHPDFEDRLLEELDSLCERP